MELRVQTEFASTQSVTVTMASEAAIAKFQVGTSACGCFVYCKEQKWLTGHYRVQKDPWRTTDRSRP